MTPKHQPEEDPKDFERRDEMNRDWRFDIGYSRIDDKLDVQVSASSLRSPFIKEIPRSQLVDLVKRIKAILSEYPAPLEEEK